MKDVRLIKGFNELADKEAVRVLSTLNYPFNPGRQRGKPVKTRLVIPITFDPKSGEKR
jgi:protein TonB